MPPLFLVELLGIPASLNKNQININKMFSEIVSPKDNELEFLEIAEKIRIKKLYFVYDFNEFFSQNIQDKIDKIKNNKISFDVIFLASPGNFNKAAKQSRTIVAKSSGQDRFIIESKKVKIIYGFEELHRKDYLHQRASGLNHVLCEIARKNNVAIGFSYSSLINKDKAQLAITKGRMIQNIKLCQKYKVKAIIASFSENPFELRAYHDVASLFRLMGMSDSAIKDSFSYRL